MRISKLISSIVNLSSFLLLGMLVHVSQPANAYKLELRDNGEVFVSDPGKVVGKVKDGIIKPENGVSLPDSLDINEIVLTYAGAGQQKDTLKVVSNNQVCFQEAVKKALSNEEISKANGLTILSGLSYSISHGSHIWTLQIVAKVDTVADNNAIVAVAEDGKTEAQENTNDESGMNTFLLVIICCIAVLIVGIGIYIVTRHRKSKNSNELSSFDTLSKNHDSNDAQNAHDTGKSNSKTETSDSRDKEAKYTTCNRHNENINSKKESGIASANSDKSNDSAGSNASEFKTVRELLDYLVPELRGLPDGQKIIVLRDKLEFSDSDSTACKDERDILNKVQQELGVENESGIDEAAILDKIRDLKSKGSQVTPQQEKSIRDRYAQELLDRMTGKKDKTLIGLVDKAKKESQGSLIEAMNRLVNMLPSALRNSSAEIHDSNDSKLITDSQLNIPENRLMIRRWVISQIRMAGYSELNPNRTDRLFDEIANALNNCANNGNPASEEEIVTAAIVDDKLTMEQKKVLVRRLIEKVNSFVGNDSNKLNEGASLGEFVEVVASKIETPSSYDDAQTRERESNLKAVSEAVECEVKDFSKNTLINALKQLIVKLLNRKIDGFGVEVKNDSYEDAYKDAFNRLSTLVKQSQKEDMLLDEYQVSTIQELPEAIEKRKDENILKSVDRKVGEFLPGKPITSIQQLINALFKLAEDANRQVKDADERESMIADDIEEKIASLDSSYKSVEGVSVLQLVDKFNALVKDNEDKLSWEIREQKESIGKLNEAIGKKDQKINSIETKNNELMSESNVLAENVHMLAENVLQACKTILNPCSDADESQCMDIEDRLYESLNASMKRLKSVEVSSEEMPVDIRKRIQGMLVDELSAPGSPIQLVCRYYAYSRLPFMTDTSREYGVVFNRKNMSELFMAVDNLYVYFGIRFDMPHLFVMGLEEGEFENLTGESYSDLDNLCSNSRNHFDNIDSNTKPSNVIVDMVSVGYSVDGKTVKKTAVLTY